jgi:hypothetical protein
MDDQVELYDAFILKESESWIIGFWITGNYMLYGKKWKKSHIKSVVERINFKMFQSGFHFLGTRRLVEDIFALGDANFNVFKKRTYYICDKVSYFSLNPTYSISVAHEIDTDEISQMVCEFFEDEYNGQNNKDINYVKLSVNRDIIQGDIWVLKSNHALKSICTIIHTPLNIPLIGTYFTKRESRNMGYGKQLLYFVTDSLLKKYTEVWLIADEDNPVSNAIFSDVGYKQIYHTLDIVVSEDLE